MKSSSPSTHRVSRRRFLAATTAGTCACLVSLPTMRASALSDDPYALDELSRTIPARGRVACPKVDLVIYRGKAIAYAQAARVFVDFKPRLQVMESAIVTAAEQTYGRAPKRLIHLGTYNCRRIAAYPTWLSEHGLGNAIDIAGFDFGALKRGESLPDGVPKSLRRPFSVRVERNWKPGRSKAQQLHAIFLRRVIRILLDKRPFRVLLGPGYPGHHNHFHFDCAPFRMVEGFDDL